MTARVKLYSIAGLADKSALHIEFAVVNRGITKLIRRTINKQQAESLRRYWDKDNKRFYRGQKLAKGLTWESLPVRTKHADSFGPFPTVEVMVKPVRYELWGNLRDGFDVNNFYSQEKTFLDHEPTDRELLNIARDAFAGYSFALSENKCTYIPRKSINFDDNYNNNTDAPEIYFEYRGQQIGYIEITTILH